MTPRLVLFLPAKDEEPNLPGLIQRAWEAGFSHVVVCDDGSQDGTGKVARALGATVLVHPVNLSPSPDPTTLLYEGRYDLGQGVQIASHLARDGGPGGVVIRCRWRTY